MNDTVLDDDLRERWEDPEAGEQNLAAARAALAQRRQHDDGDPVARSHVGRAYQRLSEACRLSGLLAEALEHKDAALEIWRAQDKFRAGFLVELQRALVLAELGDLSGSAEQMRTLGEQLEGDERLEPYYRDFWLEYDARRACMAGDRQLAAERLEEALAFRRGSRAERIIRWTQMALRKVRSADDDV